VLCTFIVDDAGRAPRKENWLSDNSICGYFLVPITGRVASMALWPSFGLGNQSISVAFTLDFRLFLLLCLPRSLS